MCVKKHTTVASVHSGWDVVFTEPWSEAEASIQHYRWCAVRRRGRAVRDVITSNRERRPQGAYNVNAMPANP